MVLIALVAVMVVGSVLHFSLVQAIRDGAEGEQSVVAGQASRQLESCLLNVGHGLAALGQDPEPAGTNPEDTAPLQRRIIAFRRAFPVARDVFALDLQGRLIAFDTETSLRPEGTLVNAAASVAARYLQSGGRFYLAAAPPAPGIGPSVLAAVPLIREGRPAGTLAARLPGSALAAPLTGLSVDRRIGLYLAAENGRFLGPNSPPGWTRLPERLLDKVAGAPVGQPVVAAVSGALVTAVRTPWTGWPVVVWETAEAAFNPIRLARWAFFVLTPLALFIAVLLAFRQAGLIAGEEARRIEHLAVAVVEAQENERRRIAQDIHDWTAQRITSSYYHVQLLEKLLAKDPALVAKELPQLAGTLDSANTELREIMRNLHPHLLNELGLTAAVRELVTDFARSAGLEYRVDVPEEAPEPPRHVAIALFRILQEALSNVEKHASAHRVEVTLRLLPTEAALRVSDDGVGFNPETAGPGRGERLGLAGMRERAELLGGLFHLSTLPGRGTTIEVIIPWNSEATPPSES